MAFHFYDPALELKIREAASKVTDKEVLKAINDSRPMDYSFCVYGPEGFQETTCVKLSDLTKKDREDIRFEIAVSRCGGSTMHGPLAGDSLQNHRIWSRSARRESRLRKRIHVLVD